MGFIRRNISFLFIWFLRGRMEVLFSFIVFVYRYLVFFLDIGVIFFGEVIVLVLVIGLDR